MTNFENLSFEEILQRSESQIVRDRSARLAKVTKSAQRAIVDKLENEVDLLQDKLDTSLDLSPDNKYSLMVGEKFNPEQWADQYQKWSIELANKKMELKIAQETMSKRFPEKKEEAK